MSGTDHEAEDLFGWTTLHYAVMSESPKIVARLLDRGCDIQAKDASGRTPLHHAASSGRAKVTTLLLDQGADIEAKDANGETPLYKAAMENRTKVVNLLVDRGADIEAKNAAGWTALYNAALTERVEVVNLLVERGADIDTKDANGQTPLHQAASLERMMLVTILVDLGADIDMKDGLGNTALHWAARLERTTIAALPLDLGADIDARDANGETPLHHAATLKRTEVAALLLDRGADADAKDANDSTPFHDAAISGHAKILNLLLDRGADLDRFGEHLLVSAANEDDETASLVRERGIAIAATNGQRRTTPTAAAATGNVSRLHVLQSISRSGNGGRVAVGCLLLLGLIGTIGIVGAIGDWLLTPSRVAPETVVGPPGESERGRQSAPGSASATASVSASERNRGTHHRPTVVTLATWQDPIAPTIYARRTLLRRGDDLVLRTRYSDGTSHTEEVIERPSGKPNERRFDIEPDNDQSEYITVTDSGVVRWFAWDGTNFLTQRASRIHADFLALGTNPAQRDCIPKQLSPTAREIVTLYEQLQTFKDDPRFTDFGFSVGGPYHQWMEDATVLAKSPPDETAGHLDQLGFTGGDVMNLGFSYLNPEVEEEKRNILDSEKRIRAGLALATCDSSVSPQ